MSWHENAVGSSIRLEDITRVNNGQTSVVGQLRRALQLTMDVYSIAQSKVGKARISHICNGISAIA